MGEVSTCFAGLIRGMHAIQKAHNGLLCFGVSIKFSPFLAVSIAAIVIAVLLFISELKFYWGLEVEEHMEVDGTR